ncbi:UDP-4-amino-4-deoxy-L-arabinose formyltransferase / UDP-glucuronic acid dehydrogenase (UDP-4-keto-hexauronic acid decarboxylating) [Gammaproteobacteria bacterium]
MKKVLILGINGFIGNQLTKKILASTDWEIYGMDVATNKLGLSLNNPRLHFTEGDITINKEWIAYHIKKCDVILPLVAVATPAVYVTDPLRVFELDFEANLPIVRQCVQWKKHLVFPSTSEVYGMSTEAEFDEETSILMQGPINKERWIYSCSKQLMDRVIYAYGKHQDLKFTLFRPFNWIGPTQDDIHSLPPGGVRLVTQLISNIFYGKDFQLVDGGEQKRCFVYIDDAIEALIKIIENKNGCVEGKIINIGNPKNNASVREVAEAVLRLAKKYTKYKAQVGKIKIVSTHSDNYYGSGYQDVQNRVPSIKRAREILGWKPKTDLETALQKTMDFYLK